MGPVQFYKYVAERGGVPQSFARQWTELIFTCLREVIIKEDSFRVGQICDFKHTIRKSRITRNPVTGEYLDAPDRDDIKVTLLKGVRRDFINGIKDGTIESKVGGYIPSRPLTREECEIRGYKTGFFNGSIAKMRAYGDMDSARTRNYLNGQIALAEEQKAAAKAKAEAESNKKGVVADKENKE